MVKKSRRKFLKDLEYSLVIGISGGLGLFYLMNDYKLTNKKMDNNFVKSNLSNLDLNSTLQNKPENNLQSQEDVTNYKIDDFYEDQDHVLLARMIFGEARSCSINEKIAVAYTAINRTKDGKKWNGETLKEVILKPSQYSCFNNNDPNRIKLLDPQKFDSSKFTECLDIAKNVISGKYDDPTDGATHYHTNNISPYWSKTLEVKFIAPHHTFYREN